MSKRPIALALSLFSVLAAFSKFGPTLDAIFLDHSFMVDVYKQLTPLWFGTSADPEMLRKCVGIAEFIAAFGLVRPGLSDQKFGATVLLFVMMFAFWSHVLMGDLYGGLVPMATGAACLHIIKRGGEKGLAFLEEVKKD